MPYKIRTKLITAFMVMLIPVLALFVFNHFQLKSFQRSAQQIEEVANEIGCLSDLQLALEMVIMPANDYLITGDSGEKEKFYQGLKEAERHFNLLSGQRICRGCHAVRQNIFDRLLGLEVKENWPDEMRRLKGIRDGVEGIKGKGEEIFAIQKPVGSREGARVMEEMDAVAHRLITEDIRRHKESDGRELDLSVKAAERARGRYLIIRTVGYSLVVVIGLFFALFYSRLFVVTIKKLHNGADAIATGAFKTRIDIKTGDEFGQLAGAMNEMAEKLDSFYGTLEEEVRERTAELRESEEKYRTMIETSNDWIWTLTPDGIFTFMNKQAEDISGYSYEEWLGKTFEPLILEEDLPMVVETHDKVVKGEKAHYEVRIKKRDGGVVILSVNASPIFKDDKVTGTISFGRDITERKEAEEKIKKQLDFLQRFEKVAVGREFRIKELRDENDSLKARISEIEKRQG